AELLREIKNICKEKYVIIEYGFESTLNKTLNLINRCHTYEQAVEAVNLTHENKILSGAHLIMGLPNETYEEMIQHARNISKLPLHTVKLHQLQILKNTKAEQMYAENPDLFTMFSPQAYIELVAEFLSFLNPDIIPERFTSESPKEMLIAPNWGGLKNFEFLHKLNEYMKLNGLEQGQNFGK
ncbi:MAG: TIGR01212 family radical SAM protein, partial [Bacteroidales bacterium]|nr:TIGR01212 family radical SAM protein [Bacteroidales bacterium]